MVMPPAITARFGPNPSRPGGTVVVRLTGMAFKRKDRIKAIEKLAVRPSGKVSMDDFDPGYTWKQVKKQNAKQLLRDGVARLAELQDMFYAQDTYSLLIVLQAMDAAGKDGTISHVMSGLNPQGCQVYSFKAPIDRRTAITTISGGR